MEKKPRVLVVDDNVGLVETLLDILDVQGYEAVGAESAFLAIEKVKKQPFDVILMDIKMPGMNGVEGFKEIKRLAPGAAVVMMTAHTLPELVAEAREEGALAVLAKPLAVERLVAFLEEWRREMPVLIVDDDVNFCRTLKDVLEGHTYTVAVAPDASQAIDMVAGRDCDVVLLDMRLPSGNGLDIFFAIRELNPKMAVILITAYRQEMETRMAEGLRHGVYACLYKPFQIDDVLELLQAICRRKRRELLEGCSQEGKI